MRLTAFWGSLLVVGAATVLGPVTASADDHGRHNSKPGKGSDAATVYEVAEWGMFVPPNQPFRRRQATATLVGTVQAGQTICPKKLKVDFCDLVILASSDISLTTGRGPVEGDFWVVVQLDNDVDGPEGIVLEGKLFDGTIDLSPAIFQRVPIGSLSGQWEAKGTKGGPLDGWRSRGEVRGTFQLPFVIPPSTVAFYLVNPSDPGPGCCEPVLPREESLSIPTVRLELSLTLGR